MACRDDVPYMYSLSQKNNATHSLGIINNFLCNCRLTLLRKYKPQKRFSVNWQFLQIFFTENILIRKLGGKPCILCDIWWWLNTGVNFPTTHKNDILRFRHGQSVNTFRACSECIGYAIVCSIWAKMGRKCRSFWQTFPKISQLWSNVVSSSNSFLYSCFIISFIIYISTFSCTFAGFCWSVWHWKHENVQKTIYIWNKKKKSYYTAQISQPSQEIKMGRFSVLDIENITRKSRQDLDSVDFQIWDNSN